MIVWGSFLGSLLFSANMCSHVFEPHLHNFWVLYGVERCYAGCLLGIASLYRVVLVIGIVLRLVHLCLSTTYSIDYRWRYLPDIATILFSDVASFPDIMKFFHFSGVFKVNNRNSRKSYEICSKLMTSFWCVFIVKLGHISYLFLLFTADFEQLDSCWNWTINVEMQLKLFKTDTCRTKSRLSALEGVHFREGFQEMRLKWRKTHKRSRAWKQKNSTYH